jgi:hypothetical protein
MIVGIGLGAGVVLAVLTFSPPRFLAGDADSETEQRPTATAVRSPSNDTPTAAKPTNQLLQTQSALPTRAEVQAEIERQQLLRQVVREELGRAVEEDSSKPIEDANPRWKSDRPSPIGEPGDDSPPLGLMLPERRTMPAQPVEEAREPTPVLAKDDEKAVAALVAAGIRCDKESEGGRVTRVDGSFRMTDALMARVAKLPGLVHLKLSFAEVTDAGLAHVKDLTQLEELILNQTKVTDAGVAHLEKLTKLSKLDLEKTLVSDDSIARLKALKQLSHLDLRGTKVSAPAAAGLKEALGGARIRH